MSTRAGDRVEGVGDPGTPDGKLLTVQGDPAGAPLPVSGTVAVSGIVPVSVNRAPLNVVGQGVAGGALTLTLPAPGVGLFHYITAISLRRAATAALAGTATLQISSTNLGPIWLVGNAMAIGGTQIDVSEQHGVPLRSQVANTATTIVMPAPGAAVVWEGWVHYYIDS
jgi:hypothetical protein